MSRVDKYRTILRQMVQNLAIQLRMSLGVSCARFSRIVGCSLRTVKYWESGTCKPSNLAARRLLQIHKNFHRSQRSRFPGPCIYIDTQRFLYYSAPPGSDWLRWNWKKRLSFMAHRAKYKRILADAQAGRCIIEYRTPKAKKVVDSTSLVKYTNDRNGSSGSLAVQGMPAGMVQAERKDSTKMSKPKVSQRRVNHTSSPAVDPASPSALLDRVAHASSSAVDIPLSEKRARALAAVASVLNPAPSVAPACPDCGSAMLWNRLIKRRECACGYQGKAGQGSP